MNNGDKMRDYEKTEVLDFNSIKLVVKDRRKIFLRTIPLLLIPGLLVLTIISTHSKKLLITPVSYLIYILLALFIYLLFLGFYIFKNDKKKKKKKKSKKKSEKKKKISIFNIFIYVYVIGCSGFIFTLYGPISTFRNWLISTSMSTMSHKYICQWFYSDTEITKVLDSNYIVEVDEETDTDLIKVEIPKEEVKYANEYEKQVLEREKDQPYKIIEMKVTDQDAYLAVIYDPSKVKVAASKGIGRKGQYATKIAEYSDALLAVNGGGFGNAPGDTTGGVPTGVTIIDGKVISNYNPNIQSGGLIGLTNENKLVLMKNTNAYEAIKQGVRDGVTWGPFLIINGKKSFIEGNGGWGYAARTAIGQRSDGIILLLVVDSNSTRTKGAGMKDLTDIMSNYGAINAANLDGGTSSVMVLPKNEALKYIDYCPNAYCYINDPIDSTLSHKTRGIATTIVLTK